MNWWILPVTYFGDILTHGFSIVVSMRDETRNHFTFLIKLLVIGYLLVVFYEAPLKLLVYWAHFSLFDFPLLHRSVVSFLNVYVL